MKRFCYICADPGIPLPGRKGASVHVASLCRAFHRLGLVGDIHTVRGECADLDGTPIHPIIVPPRRKHKSLEDRENRLFLARVDTIDEKPDFIYERYSLWHPGGVFLARQLGIPFVLEVNSPLPLETKRFRQMANESLADGISRLLMREADIVVCVSEEIKQWVISERLHSAGVMVVPNGVDEQLFHPDVEKRPSRLPGPETKLIGFTSTFRPWHGTTQLLETFRYLVEDLNSSAHLVCIGDGPERVNFLDLAKEAGLEDRIHAPGKLPHSEVNNWLASCDVAVAPYPKLEDFWFSPLKIFEYFCCGLPVVASAVGQIQDLLADDRGTLIPIDDNKQMAISIQHFLDHPEIAQKVGQQSRQWVLENATWKIRARQILTELENFS
ncbi:MAG: glycosyltransferase family 4 protein [Planctomycetota bacterium]|nr:glycosyltransferase family 4 protein [Planctomycetota bacterium]